MNELEKYKITLKNGKTTYCIGSSSNLNKEKFIDSISKLDLDIEIITIRTEGFNIYINKKIKTILDKYFNTTYLGKGCGCFVLEGNLSLDYENKHEYYVEFR